MDDIPPEGKMGPEIAREDLSEHRDRRQKQQGEDHEAFLPRGQVPPGRGAIWSGRRYGHSPSSSLLRDPDAGESKERPVRQHLGELRPV